MYLRPGYVLQLQELLHEDLVDLHQDAVHPVSAEQGEVSVALHIHTQVDCKTIMVLVLYCSSGPGGNSPQGPRGPVGPSPPGPGPGPTVCARP